MILSHSLALRRIKPEEIQGKKTLHLFIAGVGAVGGTLLHQIENLDHPGVNLDVIGICNRNKMKWKSGPESPSELSEQLYRGNVKSWDLILESLATLAGNRLVFVDATGSSEVAELYQKILEMGIHIVTPSKIANTRSQFYFDSLLATAHSNGVQYQFETTVGAGLPVIAPIKNLLDTGDKIIEISGVLSGTMTYLFDEIEKGSSFSEAVIRARTLGYAEPDPRDDLSGEDVARKFLILARVCGKKIERDQIRVESLIPDFLKKSDSATFLQELHRVDGYWEERLAKSRKQGKTLRYTGTFSNDSIQIGIREVEKKSPAGQLTGTNNLIQIKTGRYYDQPLIIQGPGAGKEVTAAGVLSDILKIPG